MSRAARILLATDVLSDAKLLEEMLGELTTDIVISHDAEQASVDFEEFKPDILVLAFKDLARCERYYLGIYRLGTAVHSLAHRALILCDGNSINQAYELCRKGHFDDYVPFWPLGVDTRRLHMAVNHAMRDLDRQLGAPAMLPMVIHAKYITELEAKLTQSINQGCEFIGRVGQVIDGAQTAIDSALDNFSMGLPGGDAEGTVETMDPTQARRELARVKTDIVKPCIAAVNAAVLPVGEWADHFLKDLAPYLESNGNKAGLAERCRPVILVVDDDGFQCKILSEILRENNFEPIFAASGTRALSMMKKRRPDLVLMDIVMPDLNGVEVTRRIKAIRSLATIPIIMITGQSEKMVILSSLQAGAVDFIVKPFERGTLLKKIHRFLSDK